MKKLRKNKYRLISILILIAIIVFAIIIGNNKVLQIAGAKENERKADITGTTDSRFTYTVNDDGTSITLTKYIGTDTDVTIPSTIDGYTVTALEREMLYRNNIMVNVTIPSTITDISGNNGFVITFYENNKIKSINVDGKNSNYSSIDGVVYNKDKTKIIFYPPAKTDTSYTILSGVTSIEEYAFFSCKSLTSIGIPSSVTSIGGSAFEYCKTLTSINVDSDNQYFASIDGVLFNKGKERIVKYPEGKIEESYIIPSSVTSIEKHAFYNCERLTSIKIPSGVTSIEEGTFELCKSLTSIEIPSSVKSIGYSAFSNCKSLTSIEIPSSVTSIGRLAFYGCTSLTSIKIPSSVTSIGSWAFRGCESLTNIEISSSVTNIEELTFAGCTSLTSIEIPSSVTKIGQLAFENCVNLTNIEIPSSVTNIENYAFAGCNDLTIYCKSGSTAHQYAIDNNIPYKLTDRALESISIKTKPTKTTYIQGESLNLAGGVLTLTYNDNTTETVSMTDSKVTISGFNSTTTGTKTVTVSYGGKSTTFTVTVNAKTLSSISVKTKPTKATYIQGESLDLAGGVLTLTYNNNTTETVNMTDSKVTTSGFDSTTAGTKTITVSYGGKSTTFTVTVNEKTLSSISVKTKPSKTTYKQGENLNLAGGQLTLTYNNNTTETVNMTDSKVTTSGFNNTTLGKQTITVSYERKTTTFDINIIQNINYEENEDGGITITGGNETEVIIPEEINGKSVTEIGDKAFADRDDLISVDIPDSVTKIADSAFEGSDDVTIICNSGSKAEDFAKEKDMNYILKDKTVDSISIKKEPTKTTYVKDEEELDLKGGRILLKYTDGDTSPISMKFTGVKVTGYDKTKAGQQELTVTFREKTTTFNVTVNAKDEPILGDISGDGKVDSTDLLLLKRHIIAGNKTEWVLKEDKFTRGDMNTDGTINSTDLLLLKRKIINR